jgi:hypothetical protein
MAISDCLGHLTIHVMNDGKEACNTLTKPDKSDTFSLEEVKTTTLDSFSNNFNLFGKISLIKIDVEGWETQLLKGGEKLLTSEDAPVLMMEFNEQMAKAAGSSCMALYEKLGQYGYQIFTYKHSGKKFVREHKWRSYEYKNLIVTKKPQEFIERIRGAELIL